MTREEMVEKIRTLRDQVRSLQGQHLSTEDPKRKSYRMKLRQLMYWKRRLTQIGKK